jgi:hypothetical protein
MDDSSDEGEEFDSELSDGEGAGEGDGTAEGGSEEEEDGSEAQDVSEVAATCNHDEHRHVGRLLALLHVTQQDSKR